MSETPPFDAYHELLGIAPSEQPPTLYRLLGVTPFESVPTVIERAADRQMAHLRTFQAGKHQADSQRLLNEVTRARQTLLNEKERATYEAKLKQEQAAKAAAAAAKPLKVAAPIATSKPAAVPNPVAPIPVAAKPIAPQATPAPMQPTANPLSFAPQTNKSRSATPRKKNNLPLVIGGVSAVVLGLGVIGLLIAMSQGNVEDKPIAKVPDVPKVDPTPTPPMPIPPVVKPPVMPMHRPMPAPVEPTPPPETVTPPTVPVEPPMPPPVDPPPAITPAPPPVKDLSKEKAEVAAAREALQTLPKFKKYFDHLNANPDTLPTNGPKLALLLLTEVEGNAAIREHAPSHLASLQEIERLATAGADYKVAIAAIDAQVNHAIPLLSPADARTAKGKVLEAAADVALKQKIKQPEREALLETVRGLLPEALQENDVATLNAIISADGKLSWTAAERLSSIQFLLPTAEQLVGQENAELSGPLLDHLDAQLLKSPVGKPRKEALDAITALRGRLTLVSAVQTAQKTLKTMPLDPAANQTVGLNLLMNRGQWRESLPHFALGSEATWRTLAADSLKAETTAEKISLADRWVAASSEENAPSKEIARQLYQEALTDAKLVGISRAAAEAKAKDLGPSQVKVIATVPVVAAPAVAAESGKSLPLNKWHELLPQVDFNQDVEVGYWLRGPQNSLRADALTGTRLYLPVKLTNCSYDFKVDLRVGQDHDNLVFIVPVGDRQVMVILDCNEGVSYFTAIKGVITPHNKQAVRGDFIQPNRQHRVEVAVRLNDTQAKVEVAVDEKKIFAHEGPVTDFSCPAQGNRLRSASQPYLYPAQTAAEFTSVQVRPISGNATIGRDGPLFEPLPAEIESLKRTALTRLEPLAVKTFGDSFAVSKGPAATIVNGEPCTEYLYAHAPSVLKYAIPANSRYFTAIAYAARTTTVKFIVRVDGKQLYSSQDLALARVLVELPAGAKELELECDPMGNLREDQCCWCFPAFRFGSPAAAVATKPAPATSSTASNGKAVPLNKWVDLFPHVDFDQDVERGNWSPGPGNSIQVESVYYARMRMPVVLTNCSYDLSAEFKTGSDADSIYLILPVGERNVILVVDGYGGGLISYFDTIAGKEAQHHPNAVREDLLKANQTHRYDVSVRLNGDNAKLTFSLDGTQRFEHEGPIAELGVSRPWQLVSNAQPALCAFITEATFTSCRARAVAGEARIGREVALVEPIPKEILAMKATPLTSLKYVEEKHYDKYFGISEGTINPFIGGKFCTDYIFAHAPSRITYAIPPNVKYFTAIATCFKSCHANFIVQVDGKELFSRAGRPIATVVVEIPAGGKLLELEVDHLGDAPLDHSCWCYPAFRLAAGAVSATTPAPATSPSAAKGKELPLNKWTEILPQVDIDQDLVRGHWHKGRDNSVSVENIGIFARLRLPVVLKDCSYDWRVDFRVGDDHNELHFIVPVGARNIVVTLDGFNDRTTGLTEVAGKPAPQVPGTVTREVVAPNSNNRMEVGVRLEGDQARLTMSLNGTPLIDYTGAIADLGTSPEVHGLGTFAQPALMVVETPVNYASSQIKLIQGNGSIGREVPLMEPIPQKILSLKPTPLTGLKPNIITNHNDQFAVNQGTRHPLVGGKECTDYLFTHAPTKVQYEIPAKAKYFTAIAYAARSPSVKFIVRVDGKVLHSSENRALAQVVVDIPEGAKILELECDPMGDVQRDHSCWCYPAFR